MPSTGGRVSNSLRGSRAGLVTTLALFAASVVWPAGGARADDVAPAAAGQGFRLSSLTVGFADDFFALPGFTLRDDDGFTAALRVGAELSDGNRERLRIEVSEQLITERGGPGRVDEGRATVTWERSARGSSARQLTFGWTLGVDVVGDLGGAGLQDWAHRAIFSGRLLSGGAAGQLQGRYPRGHDVLALAGGHLTVAHPLSGPWSLRGGVEALLGFGTGIYGELHPYLALGFATRLLDLELREGAAAYGTNVRALQLRGGYVTDRLQSQPSVRVTVLGPRSLGMFVSMSCDLNRGDSHQTVGELTVGTRF